MTFDPRGMGHGQSWQYYVASWQRNEPTEGVPRNSKFWPPRGTKRKEFGKTILHRNLETASAGSEDEDILKNIAFEENLVVRIESNTYKLEYNKGGADTMIRTDKFFTYDSNGISSSCLRMMDVEKRRTKRFIQKLVNNNTWMQGLNQDEINRINNKYTRWVKDGLLPNSDME